MIFKKALCLCLTVGMLCLAGCEGKSKGSVKYEYGNTMITKSEGLPFPVEFDSHFVTDEEASAIVNYYYSIAQQDEELAKQSSYPNYIEYFCRTYEFDSIKDFLKSNYDTIGNFLEAENYEFKSIKITKCVTDDEKDVYTNFEDIDSVLNESEAGVSSKIQKRKLVEAEIICKSDDKEISLSEKAGDQQLYIYTIDNKPYVL